MKVLAITLPAFIGLQSGELPEWPVKATGPVEILVKIIETCKIPSHHNHQLAYTGVALYESIVAGDKSYRSLAGQLK